MIDDAQLTFGQRSLIQAARTDLQPLGLPGNALARFRTFKKTAPLEQGLNGRATRDTRGRLRFFVDPG